MNNSEVFTKLCGVIHEVSINLLFQVSVQAKYRIEHNRSHLD